MVSARLHGAGGRVRAFVARVCLLGMALVTGAHADSPPATSFPSTGAYTATLKATRNNVAVIELAGNYARDLNGQVNVEPRAVVAKEFYRNFADRYDFLVVFSNFEFETGDAKAFHLGVRNDVDGIGLQRFDNSAHFGSRGTLQSYIDMAALSRYNLSPGDPRFEEAMRVLSHELLHRWAAHVKFMGRDGQPSTALLGKDDSHWSFMLDTGGSVEYGNRWKDNGDGTFTSQPDRQFFSPLDLYLMGMLKKEEVPPFFYIENATLNPARLSESGVTISGVRRDVTIDQVVAAEGPRVPSADNAQKQFRVGFVLLTRPGVPVSDDELTDVNAVRQVFETRLTALTAGRALAHAYLEPKPLAAGSEPTLPGTLVNAPGSTANVITALGWLRGKQQDGAWHDNPLTRLRDTVVATSALTDVGGGDSVRVDRAMAWLGAQSVTNTDYVARRIIALSAKATEADWARLASAQNADGGWGVAPGYQSTPLDTALAATAAELDPNPTRQALARERAKAFLLSKQNADGGWSHAVHGVSRTATTAQVVRALATLDAAPQVATAARFLAGRQNTDGGFGDSPSTTHDTSNVLLALASAGQLGAVRTAEGFNFLNATQQPDGSWDGSIYATALAIRTLGVAQTYNWAASTLTATPATVRDGQRVALSMLVSNSGVVAAPAGLVRVFDGDPSAGIVLAEMPVPPLEAGRSAVVRGTWSTLNQAGNRLLTAVIDPASAGTEMTRTDNTATVRVAVASAPVQADLTVTAADVQVLPSVINRLPTTVSVVTQIANIGQTDALNVKVRLLSGLTADTMVVVDEKVVNLLGRSTIAMTTSFQVTRPGRQKLSVVIDAEGTVGDIDPANNRADLEIDTVSSFDPAVHAADLAAPAATLGSDVALKATLHNHGTADTPPFQAVFTVTDGTVVREVDRIAVQLPPNGDKSFTLPWRVDLSGALEFKVVLDPAGAVSDLDRTNNEATVGFTAAAPAAGPNLVVGFRDFFIEPDPALEGSPLTLKATVRNAGTLLASNIEFGFYAGDPANGGTLLAPIQVLPELAAGASAEVTALVPKIAGTADRVYFIAVDPAGKITESARDDNTAFRVVEVRSLPDLAVSAGNVTLSPSAPTPGDVLTVTVKVPNLGRQPANAVVVRLLDGDTVLGERTIESIAAQAEGLATMSFTLPSQAAARFLTVVVDPGNTIVEGNEANNTATRSLAVQNGAGFVSEPFFSPNGDGVKDTVTFGFRLSNGGAAKVVVRDEKNAVVRTFTGLGAGPQSEGAVTWDGRDDFQRMVNDGAYRFNSVGASGETLSEAGTVLDTNRMPILRASGTPAEYYRNLTCRLPAFRDWTTTLDEQSFFLTSSSADRLGIFRVALQGGESSTVVPASWLRTGSEPANLSASARGDRVVFSRHVQIAGTNGQSTSRPEIWTVGADGTGLRMMAAGDAAAAADKFDSVFALHMTHDGAYVVAHQSNVDGGEVIRRYPVDPANGASRVVYDSREHGQASVRELRVAPNRRRALLRVWNSSTNAEEMFVLDFETGALSPAPAGMYPPNVTASVKWAPDSRQFLLYGSVADMGVEANNVIDFEFDVFDADFQLARRFRTQKGPNNTSWYGGQVTGPEWSGSGDEFAFALNPHPYMGEGSTPESSGTPGADGPGDMTFYRAHLAQGTLTPVPVDQALLAGNPMWWATNDRSAMVGKSGYDENGNFVDRPSSIDVDSGANATLFAKWWAPEVNPDGHSMSISGFAPSGRRLFFTSYRDSQNIASACYVPDSFTMQLYTYESLHNLVADLQPLRDPRVGGVLLRGTAADVNFGGYQLDYANTATPNAWHPVALPGTEQKIGVNLANWAPPGYGSYFVRLTVTDRAGNAAAAIRRVTWSDTPPITDLLKDLDYISPNGDGVQDKVTLKYRVLEPVHLAFEVKREDGTRVRLVERDHANIGADFAFEWDGRDDEGRQAPDGKYTLRVLDYEFQVEVDTVFPELTLEGGKHAFTYEAEKLGQLQFSETSREGASPTIDFELFDDDGKIRILDGMGRGFFLKSVGSGPHRFAWDGKDSSGIAVPAGTYVVKVSRAASMDAATFTAELSFPPSGPEVVFRRVQVEADLALQSNTRLEAGDRLLNDRLSLVDFGYGDPPSTWTSILKDLRQQDLPPGASFSYLPLGDKDGITRSEGGATLDWRRFSGSRWRVSVQDKAGNAVVGVTPFHDVQEAVLWTDRLAEPASAALYWSDATPEDVKRFRIVGATLFNEKAVPVVAQESSSLKGLRALSLTFVDNLAVPAPRVELRYAFVPVPEPKSGERTVPMPVPSDADMRLLRWTSLPLRGAAATESAEGVRVEDNGNFVFVSWKLPHTNNGIWLYQYVLKNANGEEVRSNVHFTAAATVSLQMLPFTAYHEPSLVCDGPVTNVAHVEVDIPEAGLNYPRVYGQRLWRLFADGHRELVNEQRESNQGQLVRFRSTMQTETWTVGIHSFVAEVLDPLGGWSEVSRPYFYVNHTPPKVEIVSPRQGQKMCAIRIESPGKDSVGFVPLEVKVTEPYASYEVVQRRDGAGTWVNRGPAGVPDWLGVGVEPTLDADAQSHPLCAYPMACEDSGSLVWPKKGGKSIHPISRRLYGVRGEFDNQLRYIPVLDPLDGVIEARVRSYGPSGHMVCAPVTIDVDGRADGNTSIDHRLFSPNGDAVLDEVTLVLTARESLTARIDLFRAEQTTVPNWQASATPFAVLASALTLPEGDTGFPWDGRGAAGQVVPDGKYVVRVTMTDDCGNQSVQLLDVEVDTTPPVINIDTPKANAAVPVEFTVKGSITDLHPLRYEVVGVSDANPDAPMALPNAGGMNEFHVPLVTWNTVGLTGGAKVLIRAFDTVGNSSQLVLPVQLTEPQEIITSFSATPDPFSPNGDGRREKATLLYSLARAANLTLELKRVSSGALIRTLLSNVPAAAGNGSIAWDGRDANGAVEPDEDVAAVLKAEVIVDGNATSRQSANTGFVLDKTPPAIAFTLPKGPVSTGAGGVVARAVDPLFAHAGLEVSINGAAFVPLADAQDEAGTMTSPLDDIPEGPITLRVKAEDRAENQSTGTLAVTIDRTPPKPALTAPKADAYISGRKQPYEIEGGIEELHLKSWQLILGTTTLLEGTALPVSTRLLAWNPLTVADGPVTLTLKAEDQAGLTGEVNVPITVDNTPPVAVIKTTGSAMYVKLGTVLQGTATDVNFANYRVELAPGGVNGTRWSEVGRGTTEIRDAALAPLTVLPADGVYGLRLTAVDKAGNETATSQEVTVDTTAPQAVTLVAELKNRRDADVTWAVAKEADVAGYILLRNGSRLNTALLTTPVYLDPGLAAGTYTYVVKVVDKAGNESEPSNEGRVVVSSGEPVAQIFAPTRDAWAAGLMDVRGTAMSPADFKEYRLYVGNGTAPTSWQLLRRSPLSITADSLSAWNTISLAEGAQYTLKLEAEDLSGQVATDRVTVKVKNTPPKAPIQLQGSVRNSDDIPLTWTPGTEPDLQGYLLYRNQQLANSTGLVIGSLVPYVIKPAAYEDMDLPDGRYRYFVQAMDMAGNVSDASNEVEFKIDNRPPHVPIAKPAEGTKVSQTVTLVGESRETDMARVQFQYKAEGSSTWVDIGAPRTGNSGPWTIEWGTEGLPYGPYQVRAVATDEGNKTDPAPGFVTLILTDLRKPDAATALKARVTGGDVKLDWAASGSGYAVGYHVYRANPDGSEDRLTSTPLDALTITDADRPDAAFNYRVHAVSAGGTESDPSNVAPAVVFTPAFEQPYTPTPDSVTPLAGVTRAEHKVTLRRANGDVVAEADADAAGQYKFDAVPLLLGDNRFDLVARDTEGNTSKAAPWHTLRGVAPAAPTGLNAAVSGHDVTLTWAANTESDLGGYVPALEGVLRSSAVTPTSATASSYYPSDFYAPERAIDGNADTGWQPTYDQPVVGQWIELKLDAPRVIDGVTLRWQPSYVPNRFRVEGFDGEVWVPLAQFVRTTNDPDVEVKLARTYRTDRIRVRVTEASFTVVLNEIRLGGLDVGTARSATFGLPDGRPNVGVVAVSTLGFPSPLAQAKPAVGDVTGPDAVVLSAQAVVSDVRLNWSSPSGMDAAGFEVHRDGVLIATLDGGAIRSYIDVNLPNAHYDYVVTAFDAIGNRGLASNVAGVDVLVTGPDAPITARASAPAGGGLVVVEWTVGTGPQPAAFDLHRALQPGGPYERVAARVPASPFDDRTVQNGQRYYYVVKGVDVAGNAGTTSGEVNARPEDRVPPATPYFVVPGRSPGPFDTQEAVTPLAGFGEPGTRIVLSRDGVDIGTVETSADVLQQGYRTNGGSAYDVSRDGSVFFFSTGSARVYGTDGTPVASASLVSREILAFRFAPDARTAAVIYRDNATGNSVLGRWDRATDALTVASDRVESDTLAFSPDGKQVALRAYDSNLGSYGLRVLDWTTGAVRFIEGGSSRAAWSPDSRTIAVTGGQGLQLIEPQGTGNETVSGLDQPGAVTWLPDGSGVLVDRLSSSGNRAIAKVAVPGLAVTVVADEPGVDLTEPVVSPDGDAFLVKRGQALVERTFAGTEREISNSTVTNYGPAVWTRAGTLGFLRSYDEFVVRTPAGQFRLPETALKVGANAFGAYAVDAAGNSSPPAVPLQVRRLSATLPDWVVANDNWFVFPSTPQTGETTDIALTVRNIGAAAPAVPLSVVIVNPEGDVTRLFSGSLDALAKDAQQTVRMPWTAGVPGRYTLRAAVDPGQTVDEVLEDNNSASREVYVTAVAGRPELQVRTGKARYAGGETVVADVVALTTGATFDGSLVTRIVDTGGIELLKFDARPVADLRFGQPRTLTYEWPSGTTFAGDYRVVAELLGADGQPVTNAGALFAIEPGATYAAAVTTDRAEYVTGDNAEVRGTVRYASGNVLSADTQAVLEVRSAAGETLAAKTSNFTGLMQGAEVRMDLAWAAVPPGIYTARLTVGTLEAPSATAEAVFTVVAPSVPLVAGKLTVAGDVFGSTEAIPTASALTNRGAPIDPLQVRVRAYEPVSGQTLATWTGVFDGVRETAVAAPGVLAGTWPLGGFEIRLEAQVGGTWVLLDRARVQAAERTPPAVVFTGPAPGAVVRSSATVTTQATPRQAPVSSVEMLQGEAWLPMQPQNATAGLYYSNGLPATEGPVTLQARATDTLSNVSSVVTLAIVIDNTPPLIQVTGVTNGGTTTAPVTPVVSITDVHLSTTEVLLDGVPFTSGTVVSASGTHTLRMKGADLAGNESEMTVTFTIDSPAVVLDGALVVSPDLASIGETVVLDARVNNGSTRALTGVAVKLVIRDRATGVVLQTFDDVANLALGGAYQRAWSWPAAGTAGALLDAVLTATVDGTTTTVAQASIQLTAPNTAIELQTGISVPKRLLVYVRCTRKEDDSWDNCLAPNRVFSNAATVATCTSDRVAFMDQYLTARGVVHTIVSDEPAFLRELRSGKYGAYWIGGGALKLGSLAAAEVQAAVRRGDGLLTEGWFPGRNAVLDGVSSLSFLGRWSSAESQIYTEGAVLPVATLPVVAPIRFSTVSGTRHATLNYGNGVVSGTYGRGHTMAFAFDLSGTLRGATETTLPSWNAVVVASLKHIERTAPPEIVGGGVFELNARVSNTGTTAQAVDYIAKTPAAAQVMLTTPQATASTVEGGLPTLRWRAAAQAGGAVDVAAMVRAPIQEGEYVVSSLVNQINANGSSTLLHDQQVPLVVSGPVGLGGAAFDQVQAVSVTVVQATLKAGTLGWLSLAKMSVADGRWNDALRQLAAAQSAWQPVTGTPAEEAKLAIARAIEAVERRL